jgi:putative selenate reductase
LLALGAAATLAPAPKPAVTGNGKTAIFGAGPAGLACAHYLALDGYPVTVFDTARDPGGVPANVIPEFRIQGAVLAADIDRIRSLGAAFVFGHSGAIDIAGLRRDGYTSVVVATGAPVPRPLPLAGAGARVVDALEFLAAVREKRGGYDGCRAVIVTGGGNTAMDAARVAARLPGRRSVTILYRRTRAEMPADREEFAAALADGATYAELSLPERMAPASGGGTPALRVREMTLGAPDASGRRAPVPTERVREMPCDLMIAAVGENPDRALFEKLGAAVGGDGRPVVDDETLATTVPGLYAAGDARRGPASIIAAAADGRRVAYAILRAADREPTVEPRAARPVTLVDRSRRGEVLPDLPAVHTEFVQRQAARCLGCDAACLRCVEVCPNRANVALPVPQNGVFKQAIQIVHLDDLCNECGNCGFFCPYDGRPFIDKPTLFRDAAALRSSGNAGFAIAGSAAAPALVLRHEVGCEATVVTRAFAEWTAAAAHSPLLAIARVIHTAHRYMVPGGQA